MKKVAVIFFLLISLALNFIYFKNGNLLGGGETGIPFYDSKRMLEISDSAWNDAYLGVYVPQAVANIPFFKIFSYFQSIGINTVYLQYTFFTFMFFISLTSMYMMVGELFPKLSNSSKIFSALFYLSNPYAVINIWGRFLLNFMFFYSLVPLFIWLFLVGIRKQSPIFAVIFALISALFSYAFSSPVHVIVFWTFLFLIAIYNYLVTKNIFTVKYFFIFLIFWFVTNYWWISQQFIYQLLQPQSSELTTAFVPGEGNLLGFSALSQSLGKNKNLLLMQHGLFYKVELNFIKHWPLIYNVSITLFLQWIFVLTVLLIAVKKNRNKWVFLFLSLFILSIFVSKGNNKPFGEIFNFLFKKIGMLQIFRNPFEKLGLLLPLSFSPLVAVAHGYLIKNSKDNKLKSVAITLLFVFYIPLFLGYPLYSGLVYSGSKYPLNDPSQKLEVKVPDDYSNINKWLNAQNDEFRYLMLPVANEGVFYNWKKGYAGVELSGLLLNKPGIASIQGFPMYENISRNIENSIIDQQDFFKVTRLLNIKYLIFRPDINYQLSTTRNPEVIINRINNISEGNSEQLEYVRDFGDLKLYTLPQESLYPKIFVASRIAFSDKAGHLDDIFLFNKEIDTLLLTRSENDSYPNIPSNGYVFHNEAYFEVPGPDYPRLVEAPYIFPHVSHLASSKIYPLILFKEKLTTFSKIGMENKTNWELILLGKRLLEAKNAINSGDYESSLKTLKLYNKNYPRVIEQIKSLTITSKRQNENVWNESQLRELFSSHLFLLNSFEKTRLNESNYITETIAKLKTSMLPLKILPYYNLLKDDNFPVENRVVYQFNIQREDIYNLHLPVKDKNLKYYNFPNKINIQLDNIIKEVELITSKEGYYLNNLPLGVGMHEISFNYNYANTIYEGEQFILDVAKDEKEKIKTIPIPDFSNDLIYDVQFRYRIIYGDGLTFSVRLDNDPPPDGDNNLNYFYSEKLIPSEYYFDVTSHSYQLNSRKNSNYGELVFRTEVWNNCKKFLPKTQWVKCKDLNTSNTYRRPTKVVVDKILIKPKLPNVAEIISISDDQVASAPQVNYQKITPEKYLVNINKATTPYLLVFSELFNSGWKLSVNNEYMNEGTHRLANFYANSWWIEKPGNYEMILEFEPQRKMKSSITFSIISILIISLFATYFIVKKRI